LPARRRFASERRLQQLNQQSTILDAAKPGLSQAARSNAQLISAGRSGDTQGNRALAAAKPAAFGSLYQLSELSNFGHSFEKID
jgi:ABC-type transporter Mla subunit MlaD